MAFFGLFSKEKKKEALDKGLEKTGKNFLSGIGKAIAGKSKVDTEVLDNLEEMLITSDVGTETTFKIIENIEARVSRDKYLGTGELNQILKEEIAALLKEEETEDAAAQKKPFVIMVVGVNGTGKTTTVGKLAARFKGLGKSVVLGASDTFRAAAVEQLIHWGKRIDVPVVSRGMNTDPASAAFDAVKQGVETAADFVIIDTAGRLHTKVNLMNELTKIRRVIQKVIPDAPHEVLLVLDGSTGQNAITQAREFTKATDVTAVAVTKLDGTAKGGVVIGISSEFGIPVKYIGIGEQPEDLQEFDKTAFVDSLFRE